MYQFVPPREQYHSYTCMPKELLTNGPCPFSSDIHIPPVKIIMKYTSESFPHYASSDFKRMRTEVLIFTLFYSKIFKIEIDTAK